MVNELNIGDHKANLLKTHKKSFCGSEAVTWLCREGFAYGVEEAIARGNKLVEDGIIKCVSGGEVFKNDSSFYYRFAIHDTCVSLPTAECKTLDIVIRHAMK